MDMYAEQILEHYKHPQNHGTLENKSIDHEEYNPLCGDKIRMQLLIEKDVIRDVKFIGSGCAISQAATSMLTEVVKGKTIGEVKHLDREDVMKLLGVDVNPARIKCALIGLKTLKLAVYEYLIAKGKKTDEKEFAVNEDE